MFHVMLILPAIIMLFFVAAILLFGIAVTVAAVVGGTTVSVLVKNKTVKQLLQIVCAVLLLTGLSCLVPVAPALLKLPAVLGTVASLLIYLGTMALSVLGIKLAGSLGNKVIKALLLCLFSVFVLAALALTLITIGLAL